MFDPIKELVLTVAATVAFSFWCFFDPSPESYAALGVAVTGIIGASIHLVYKAMGGERFKVNIKAFGSTSSVPPFGTGEPMHLQIELTLINSGNTPVFVVSALLKNKSGSRSIGFSDVCNETEPLQPGGRRKGVLKLLYHQPYPQYPHGAYSKESLKHANIDTYKLLRFICQTDSVFQVETGRGTRHEFKATKVCDSNFLGWPFFALPGDIEKDLHTKTIDDFIKEERAILEASGVKFADPDDYSTSSRTDRS